jgi:hypothetical protein
MGRQNAATLGFLLMGMACAPMGRSAQDRVRIVVHNPGADAVMVRTCGPVGCTDFRQIAAGARRTFVVSGGGGTRAVVEGKLGDQFVARHPVDFAGGGSFRVELAANL